MEKQYEFMTGNDRGQFMSFTVTEGEIFILFIIVHDVYLLRYSFAVCTIIYHFAVYRYVVASFKCCIRDFILFHFAKKINIKKLNTIFYYFDQLCIDISSF